MRFRIVRIERHEFLTSNNQPLLPTPVEVEFSPYFPEEHLEYRDGPGEYRVSHYHDDSDTKIEETPHFEVPAGRKALIGYTGLRGLIAPQLRGAVATTIINRYENALKQAGAIGVELYVQRLCNNANSPAFADFCIEGDVALTLLRNSFSVTLREAPDLSVEFAGIHFFAEVKHFREKLQDQLDNINMAAPITGLGELVQIGDTILLEGLASWEQIVQTAKRKIKGYKYADPYVLIIGSDSENCITYEAVLTAVNCIREEVTEGTFPELAKLNGMLLLDLRDWINLRETRNAYFFPIFPAPLTSAVWKALDAI